MVSTGDDMRYEIMKYENIRSLRIDNNYTQKQIAEVLGISQNTYSQYEVGVLNYPVDAVVKLADFYNVSTDYLLGRTRFYHSLHTLNHKINDRCTVGHLMNKIISLDVQSQEEILDYTEYRLYRSNQAKIAKKNRQKNS